MNGKRFVGCLSGVVALALTAAGAEPLGPVAVATSSDGKMLYVACRDARQALWLDLAAERVVRRIDLPAEPTGLAVTPDGSRLLVVCAAAKSVVLAVDAASGATLAALPAGHTAMGPALSPDGRRLYVCNRFDNDVSAFDLEAMKAIGRAKAVREPVAAVVSADGKTVFVANHLPNDSMDAYPVSAQVSLVDAATLVSEAIRLPHGSHSARAICRAPGGKHVFVTHLVANFELMPIQVEMGWMNMNVLSVLDVAQKKVVNTVGLDELYEASANPWGVACSADGRWVCVAHAGTHELNAVSAAAATGSDLVRMYTGGVVGALPDNLALGPDLRRRIKLPGKGPHGLALAGSKAYAAQRFSDSIAMVDLADPPDAPAREIALGPRPPLAGRRLGELLFNDGTLCRQQWQSCASCHPDGRADVLNWDLMNDGMGNPKNTKSMLLSFQTPPSMAEGVRPSARESVRAGMGNILFANPPEEESAAIDEYLRGLQPVPSPRLVDGRLSAAAERGKALFDSPRTGCARCHPAPHFTDLKMHDVGTKGKYEFADKYDTPTLVEVWRTAPYLHHGHYVTIKEMLQAGSRHGRVADLSAGELDDLVEYVLSL